MSTKICLDYDPATGVMTDKLGLIVGTHHGLNSFDFIGKISIDDVIALKNSGFSVDEIVELKRQKMIG